MFPQDDYSRDINHLSYSKTYLALFQ